MKKLLLACLIVGFGTGCDSDDDIAYTRLGSFSDSYRQTGWSDAEYEAYYEWFHEHFGSSNGQGGFEIIHNMNELAPFIQYGLIDDSTLKKVNFDAQVVLVEAEGLAPSVDIRIVKDRSSVVSFSPVFEATDPQCCTDNCPRTNEPLTVQFASMFAVDRMIATHEVLRSVHKCR